MKAIRLLVGLVLLVFTAESFYVFYRHGLVDSFALATANGVVLQIVADLYLALAMIAVWMVADSRERGISVAPYLVMTPLLGSIGPLLYLWRRLGSAQTETAASDARLVRRPA